MLDLPEIAKQPAPACAWEPEPRANEIEISCDPPRIKVLVVEDDAADFKLIERCLQHMALYEAQIVLAGSLEAGRFAISADDFDLVLLDYEINGECGVDLLADMTERGGVGVILSSFLNSDMQHEALEMGAAACLAKCDLSAKVLETVIRQALREQALQQTLKVLSRSGLSLPPTSSRIAPANDTPAAPVAGEWTTMDAQALVVAAAARVSARFVEAGIGEPSIRLNLRDQPIYVRGDRRNVDLKIEEALVESADREISVSIEQAGVWNEIVIEPAARAAAGGSAHRRRSSAFGEPAGRTSILLPAADRS